MARKRGVRVQIVVEDEALERFVRETLLLFGFARHELRVTPYPVGKGSGKDWIDQQYVKEVNVLRAKTYQRLAVVVGTDADELSVAQRADRLAAALRESGGVARSAAERIIHWIPKWNVETWILYFAGEIRDEDNNYKHDVRDPDHASCADGFLREYRQFRINRELTTQPSLKLAYAETERIDA